MNTKLKTVEYSCDLCVVGGGLAGTIAALTAARKGAKVVLVQDRPVLGGNSSSEIRMWVRGAQGKYNRETGILAEFEEENIYRNPTLAPALWDSILYGKVKENDNITLLLNSSVLDAECDGETIKSVTAWQLTTYSYHKINAKYFADCSGDSILAPLTGALYTLGREARSEHNEKIGPEVADRKTMGMSCLLQARETDHPVNFIPPEWANVYESDEDFSSKAKDISHSTIRDHNIGTSGCNLWWMELGGDTEPLENAEKTRDELLKVVFGIWDHIKNRGDHGADNWELEWVGFLPGKRETFRYVGDYVLTQNDIEAGGIFPDVVAYGGWTMDDHNPKGIKATGEGDVPSIMHPAPSPYGIPYRCLYSKNISNLFFAGRNISVTHAALSSTRVMGTCSLLGQAVGNAAAICVKNGILPRDILRGRVNELQQEILSDGVFLPGVKREIPELTRKASLSLSDKETAILKNGIERPRADGDENHIVLEKGNKISFNFEEKNHINELRIQFDPDFGHESVSPNRKMRVFAQKLNVGRDFVPVKVAKTIVKEISVYADGALVYESKANHNSFVRIPLDVDAKDLTVRFGETWGDDKINIFACDLA